MGERPLWNADDQRSRLDELTASTTNPAKDLPLRRDVRLLGTLLGRVLVEQVGESLLGVVEELRRIFIQHREQPRPHTASPDFQDPLLNQARNLISRLSIDEAHRVTKAFAIYFELTNLAETNHRKRRRRAGKLNSTQTPLPGSFRGTLLRMRNAGMSGEQALSALSQVKVVPVF